MTYSGNYSIITLTDNKPTENGGKDMNKIRDFFERVFDRETWEQNNAPISKPLTAEQMVKEAHKEYHRNTYTKLYFDSYEL